MCCLRSTPTAPGLVVFTVVQPAPKTKDAASATISGLMLMTGPPA